MSHHRDTCDRVGWEGRPPPVPEDGLPVLRADIGVRGGVLRPVGKALSRRTAVAPARARAVAGGMVLSAHAGLCQVNDSLWVHGTVKLPRGLSPTPSAGVGAIFFRKGPMRRESLREGRARRRLPRGGRSEGGAPPEVGF